MTLLSLILPASPFFVTESVRLLLSSVNISKSLVNAVQNAQIGHLAKDEGFYEVGGRSSVRSELTYKPLDKRGYDRRESGSCHHG